MLLFNANFLYVLGQMRYPLGETEQMRHTPTQKTISIKEYLILDKKIKNNLTSMGLKMTDLRILDYLNSHDYPFNHLEKITAERISRDLDLDRGWVFKAIKRLEDGLYIGRNTDGKVSISGRGKTIYTHLILA